MLRKRVFRLQLNQAIYPRYTINHRARIFPKRTIFSTFNTWRHVLNSSHHRYSYLYIRNNNGRNSIFAQPHHCICFISSCIPRCTFIAHRNNQLHWRDGLACFHRLSLHIQKAEMGTTDPKNHPIWMCPNAQVLTFQCTCNVLIEKQYRFSRFQDDMLGEWTRA